MENASKALLMSAEVLIGVILLSILVYVANSISKTVDSFHEANDKIALDMFNAQFIKYVTQNVSGSETYIYAEDVITIVNLAYDWNRRTYNEDDRIIVNIQNTSPEYTINNNPETNNLEFINKEDEFLKKYRLIQENDTSSPQVPPARFTCEVTYSNLRKNQKCYNYFSYIERIV